MSLFGHRLLSQLCVVLQLQILFVLTLVVRELPLNLMMYYTILVPQSLLPRSSPRVVVYGRQFLCVFLAAQLSLSVCVCEFM